MNLEADNPMLILENALQGGLGTGHLGVVMARAGVGKTALLVRIGLFHALRDRPILHVSLAQSLEHTSGWYDALFAEYQRRAGPEDPLSLRAQVQRRRLIQAFPDRSLSAARLRKVVDLYADNLEFRPAAILVDGYDWESTGLAQEEVTKLKEVAGEVGAELWMAAQTHREKTSAHPMTLVPPCDNCEPLIDVAIYLEPEGQDIRIRLLKNHDLDPPATDLKLDPFTMRVIAGVVAAPLTSPQSYTLLSGGHGGAEAAFGEAAQRWGARERNFSFAGREPVRKVSVVELDDDALRQGAVSSRYVEHHLGRRFPNTPPWKKLLGTLWHQVSASGQVFVVGILRDDGTVIGGTGWAAELAKHLHKPLHLFDQATGHWLVWRDGAWGEDDPPRIQRQSFCGTGTQSLSDAGRAAIEALFERSFGPPA